MLRRTIHRVKKQLEALCWDVCRLALVAPRVITYLGTSGCLARLILLHWLAIHNIFTYSKANRRCLLRHWQWHTLASLASHDGWGRSLGDNSWPFPDALTNPRTHPIHCATWYGRTEGAVRSLRTAMKGVYIHEHVRQRGRRPRRQLTRR